PLHSPFVMIRVCINLRPITHHHCCGLFRRFLSFTALWETKRLRTEGFILIFPPITQENRVAIDFDRCAFLRSEKHSFDGPDGQSIVSRERIFADGHLAAAPLELRVTEQQNPSETLA